MMKKIIKTPFVLAIGTSLLSITAVQAESFENDQRLFAITELPSAYMSSISKDDEGKCGEGKCGEGTCGDKNPS